MIVPSVVLPVGRLTEVGRSTEYSHWFHDVKGQKSGDGRLADL
jgi:hypothetical protein